MCFTGAIGGYWHVRKLSREASADPVPDGLCTQDPLRLPREHGMTVSSGRRWLRARRPELYESLTRRTGQEQQQTRRVRVGG